MENTTVIILTSSLTTALIAAIVYVFRQSIMSYFTSSIRHKFDKKLLDYQESIERRKKAAIIAELLSEWISYPTDRKRLNQLTFEAYLWLPKDIAGKLSKTFARATEAPDIREILSDVREHLLGEEEKIEAYIINVFPNPQ